MKEISKAEGKILNRMCPEHITRTTNKYYIDESSEAQKLLTELRNK